MAQNPLDSLIRRTRIGMLNKKEALNCLDNICEIYKEELNWTAEKFTKEKESNKQRYLELDF